MRRIVILALCAAILFVILMLAGPVSANVAGLADSPDRGALVSPEITVEPKPYDEKKDKRPLPNTHPEANVANRKDIKLPDRSSKSNTRAPGRAPAAVSPSIGPLPSILPGSGDTGFWIYNSWGVYAVNPTQLDFVIPPEAVGTTIYAPTHMPSGGACIETVAAHWYYPVMSGTAHGHGFWDHCGYDGQTGWQTFEFMTDAWKSQYVRHYRGEDRYFTQAFRDSAGCWRGLLYNFVAGQWEDKIVPVCGNGYWGVGWTMWESHYLMSPLGLCPKFPNIQTLSLQVLTSEGWKMLDDTRSSRLGPYGICWTDGTYRFQDNRPANWRAFTK